MNLLDVLREDSPFTETTRRMIYDCLATADTKELVKTLNDLFAVCSKVRNGTSAPALGLSFLIYYAQFKLIIPEEQQIVISPEMEELVEKLLSGIKVVKVESN